MVGIRSFPFVARPIFGCYVSFREGIFLGLFLVLKKQASRPYPGDLPESSESGAAVGEFWDLPIFMLFLYRRDLRIYHTNQS